MIQGKAAVLKVTHISFFFIPFIFKLTRKCKHVSQLVKALVLSGRGELSHQYGMDITSSNTQGAS